MSVHPSSFGTPRGRDPFARWGGRVQAQSELPILLGEGTSFLVEGSAQIDRLPACAHGPLIALWFADAGAVLAHSSALQMPNSTSQTLGAGSVALMLAIGEGNWQCAGVLSLTEALRADIAQSYSATQKNQLQHNIGVREVLVANRTYYVRTDGSEGNTGLVNTAGGAFLTIQKAIDTIVNTLDLAGFAVTIQVADGTYTTPVVITPWTGNGLLIIQGNTGNQDSVIISTTSANAIMLDGACPGAVSIRYVKLQTTTSGASIFATNRSKATYQNVTFGPCASTDVAADFFGQVVQLGPSKVVGARVAHWHAEFQAIIYSNGNTITLTSTPTYTYWAGAAEGGVIITGSNTYTGSGTGSRFLVHKFGQITAETLTTLPGSTAGTEEIGTGGYFITSSADRGAWTAFTPSIGSTGGTSVAFSYAAGDSTYELIAKRFRARILGQITFTGAPSKITVTLPLSLAAKGYSHVRGINLSSWDDLLGAFNPAATTVDLFARLANPPFAGTGTFFVIDIDIEVQ